MSIHNPHTQSIRAESASGSMTELLFEDLSRQDDEQLRARAMQALGTVALLVLKHARGADDLLAKMVAWAGMLREVLEAPDGLEALGSVMRYAILVNDRVTVRDIETRVATASSAAEVVRAQLASARCRLA